LTKAFIFRDLEEMASQHLPRLVQETIEKLTPEELVFGPDPVDY